MFWRFPEVILRPTEVFLRPTDAMVRPTEVIFPAPNVDRPPTRVIAIPPFVFLPRPRGAGLSAHVPAELLPDGQKSFDWPLFALGMARNDESDCEK